MLNNNDHSKSEKSQKESAKAAQKTFSSTIWLWSCDSRLWSCRLRAVRIGGRVASNCRAPWSVPTAFHFNKQSEKKKWILFLAIEI
jgi:hypothetical protein